MSPDAEVGTTTLRHNPLNAVTATVERVTYVDGRTLIRKELRRPANPSSQKPVNSSGRKPVNPSSRTTVDESSGRTAVDESSGREAVSEGDPWAGSGDPRHWNYWRREVEVYRDDELRKHLAEAGLVLPDADVVEHADGAVLMLEDIEGTHGTEFSLAEHAALSRACGRWQARPAPDRQWTSNGFLRDYSTSRDVPWDLVDDDTAWQQPLVAETWPPGLREAWRQLLAHRNELLDLVARLPRARCHLDLWVSNVIQRPTGELALLDWAFTGDGALGEDLGNHIPDAVFDLFWPAERLPELAETCVDNYLDGLREAGWRGSPDDVRRAVMASGVKYAWLLPGQLARASDASHKAYHQQADSQHLFNQRGQALRFVANWCAQALKARP